jgi:hypothetical protein
MAAKKPKGKWTAGRNKADNGDRVTLDAGRLTFIVLDSGDIIVAYAGQRLSGTALLNSPAPVDGVVEGTTRLRLTFDQALDAPVNPDDGSATVPDETPPIIDPSTAFEGDEIDGG